MNLDDLAIREPQHLMVFGDSGTGKSTLVSQLAHNHKLIWVSVDNGHRVLYKLPEVARKNIDIIVIQDTRDAPIAFDTCRKLMRLKPVEICHKHGLGGCSACKKEGLGTTTYDFGNLGSTDIVVFDHISAVTDSCMAQICKGQDVDYKPKLDDWGSLLFHMKDYLQRVQHAPFNVVCIAQAMESELEDGKKKLVPQVGSREFGKLVNQFFDHIVYTELANKAHKTGSATTYSASAQTKSRTDIAIEQLKEPSLEPFFSGEIKKVDAAANLSALEKLRAKV